MKLLNTECNGKSHWQLIVCFIAVTFKPATNSARLQESVAVQKLE